MAARKRSTDKIQQDRTETMRLYLEGKTQAAIAERLGVHRSQIGYDLEQIRKAWKESTLVDFNEKKTH